MFLLLAVLAVLFLLPLLFALGDAGAEVRHAEWTQDRRRPDVEAMLARPSVPVWARGALFRSRARGLLTSQRITATAVGKAV